VSKEGYIYTPYIPIIQVTIPNIKFIGYDKDGKAKFKKLNQNNNE
jgi:hypothetical protein